MIFAPCIYAGRMGLTAWRKKSTILIAILLLALIIFGVHYNIGYGSNVDVPQKEAFISDQGNPDGLRSIPIIAQVSRRKNLADIDSNSVHFVQNGEPKLLDHRDSIKTEPYVPEKDIQNLEQPSRDEIARRREAAGDGIASINNDQINFENYAIQPQSLMGVPFVNVDTKNPYIPGKRVIHLDLKGAPPKVTYLKRLFPLLKTLGATGLLLEYEDMFPFYGILEDISAKNAYSKEQVQEILQAAKDNDLEVIPLIQTFGHLEFALKRESFSHLREVPDSPQALCPSLNTSMDFIETMINQVMDLHGDRVKYLHIGCDEVFQMGECARCRRAAGGRDALFLRHVRAVAALLARRRPAVRALLWDDMLRHVPLRDLLDSGIGTRVEPMVWVYAEDVYRFVPTHIWDKYATVFPTVWSASAFKGAFGETEYVPNARRHLENNLRWLELMHQEGVKFRNGFTGIAITGWQRYDHFAVLCELLPASIPSLAVSLSAVSRGHFDSVGADTVATALGCPGAGGGTAGRTAGAEQPSLALNTDPHMWDRFGRCLFPGNSFFKLTYRLHVAESEVKEYLEQTTRLKGWLTPYNVRHNYSAPLRILELSADLPRLLRSLSSLARSASDALADYCDIYTIAEWVEQRIYPDIIALEKLQAESQTLLHRKIWERRPLRPLDDLKRFGLLVAEAERH